MTSEVIFGQTLFGLKAGLIVSAPKMTNKELFAFESVSESPNPGFYIGGVANFNVSNHLIIRPELSYASLRYTETINRTAGQTTVSFPYLIALNYVVLNLDLGWQAEIGKGKLQIVGGPYLSRGISGRWKYVGGKDSGHIDPGTVPAGRTDRYFNPLDYGINICMGYQIHQSIISVKYAIGLENTQPYYADSRSQFRGQIVSQNRALQIGFTYLFKRSKKD